MKRTIYLICQKNKGKPQVISDGRGKLKYVFASQEGLKRIRNSVKKQNQNYRKQQVHIRKAILEIKGEIR